MVPVTPRTHVSVSEGAPSCLHRCLPHQAADALVWGQALLISVSGRPARCPVREGCCVHVCGIESVGSCAQTPPPPERTSALPTPPAGPHTLSSASPQLRGCAVNLAPSSPHDSPYQAEHVCGSGKVAPRVALGVHVAEPVLRGWGCHPPSCGSWHPGGWHMTGWAEGALLTG